MNIVTMVSASSLLYEHCDLRAISARRVSSQFPDTGIQFLLPGKFSGFQAGMTSFTM
ncbi:hypothetical protein [Wolbachia endosymbiont of Nomada panzeri]|uniref:hypothetical protein n=1 Tax=Wolbachia endosymbiont of Nomada panzeri TaxID=1854760 RepID=UPI0012E73C64|nr:hypothetical protein [Wolbachia endosymbiont of Nomada panzeri]